MKRSNPRQSQMGRKESNSVQEITLATTKELARLSELIDTIYQGATDPSRWDVVLASIANWVGPARGLLFTPLNSPDNGGFYFNYGTPEPMMQLWGTRYQPQDIWAIRAIECGLMKEGNVMISDEFVSFEELSSTEFYQDFLSKYDTAHLLSGIVYDMGSLPTIPSVVCSLHRGLKEGPFTPAERDRLALLIPHLSRSLGVMTRLRGMELTVAASLATLDRLNVGVLLFNAVGLVAFANRAAHRILESEDGLQLKHRFGDSSLGEVVAQNRQSHDALVRAIGSAVSPDILHATHFSCALVISRPSGRLDYTLNFSSLATQNEFGSGADAPRAIAFITDSVAPITLDSELLKKAYGLTPAEVRLVEKTAECLTVEEAADQLGVSRNTAKTQLQNIYGKTNTNNRAKLMKLIISLAQIAN